MILYGFFLKIVIADRAAIIVNTVYGDSKAYPGFYIVVATIFFAIQIYCDFYGYSIIARGSARLIGIELMDNFKAPYYAASIKEFWQRWHISLSGWFRDYLYIPLGGNRRGIVRKNANLLVVFGISGLWHGASLSFIIWGGLNGVYQVAENAAAQIKEPVMKHFNSTNLEKANRFSRRTFQRASTFLFVTFAWLFFRAGSIHEAFALIRSMFSSNNWLIFFDGSLYGLGVPENPMQVLLISVIALFVVDYKKYYGKNVLESFLQQGWWFRVSVVMVLIFMILLYGCYGETYDIQQFIYFQF